VVRLGRCGEDRCCVVVFILRVAGSCSKLDVECVGMYDITKLRTTNVRSRKGDVSDGVGWCVGMKLGDVVCCGFVGRRLRGNGERLCGCRKSQGYGEE